LTARTENSRSTILIVAEQSDAHAIAVQRAVERDHNISCIILDTARYPSEIAIDWRPDDPALSSVNVGGARVGAASIKSVWRRRLLNHEPSNALNDEVAREVSRRDTRAALDGFLFGLQTLGCECINDPCREPAGLNKVFQLAVAHGSKLEIPATLISNDPERVVLFVRQLERAGKTAVFKGFHSPRGSLVTTKRFVPADIERLPHLRHAPAIFQEEVDGKNIHVTVVDRRAFAAEVLVSMPEAQIDWRLEVYNDVRPHALPPLTAEAIVKLVASLGLAMPQSTSSSPAPGGITSSRQTHGASSSSWKCSRACQFPGPWP
jgi:hypothetical protein